MTDVGEGSWSGGRDVEEGKEKKRTEEGRKSDGGLK